jgi:hypothetical protein
LTARRGFGRRKWGTYELGRVLEDLPPGALGLGDPDRRNHRLLSSTSAATEKKLLRGREEEEAAQCSGRREP